MHYLYQITWQVLISGIFIFLLKAGEYLFIKDKRAYNGIVVVIVGIITIGSGLIHFLILEKSAQTSLLIKAEREVSEKNNQKKYSLCEHTKIYLDGELKGQTPLSIKTKPGEHWLHLRYEPTPFFEECGPEELSLEIRNNAILKKLDKKRGRLRIIVPHEAKGVAEFKITGKGCEKNTKSMCISEIPFGRYYIEGTWGKYKDDYDVVIISREDNYAFLFKRGIE